MTIARKVARIITEGLEDSSPASLASETHLTANTINRLTQPEGVRYAKLDTIETLLHELGWKLVVRRI